jgi:hypothetical protein
VRPALLLLLVVACDQGKQQPSQGSGLPAPQATLMTTVANGVFVESPRTASSSDATTLDAAVGPPTLSADGGLSTLGRLEWHDMDELAVATVIKDRIGMPGVTVSVDVVVVPAHHVTGKESYWSIKRGDQEIIQGLRGLDGAPEGPRPAKVVVVTPEVPTVDGIKVGDTVATLQTRFPDLACRNRDDEWTFVTVRANVECRTLRGGIDLAYIVDARGKKKLKFGDVKPSAIKTLGIVAIAHAFYD